MPQHAARPEHTEGPRPRHRPRKDPALPPTGVPVPGEGPDGDHAVQRLLERAAPSDLPRAQQRRLVNLASRILRAEATGKGRENWPTYFPRQPLRAPYRDVRIQAATARRDDGNADRVRVRLVWAGTDPAGQAQDGRPARILLIRHNTAWEPTR